MCRNALEWVRMQGLGWEWVRKGWNSGKILGMGEDVGGNA